MEMSEIVERISTVGGNVYLVGGSVRDKLMNRQIHDYDYCVTGLTKESFLCLFPDAFLDGRDFPVFRLDVAGTYCEFALARRERKVGIGHQAFDVEATEDVTIEEDLLRRDITINAMAIALAEDTFLDPYGGESDIQSGTIRAVSSAFAEDPLRVYRVARFAAKFEFAVESKTQLMMRSLLKELITLSSERVFEELKKALACPRPSVFFRCLHEVGVLAVHFPEIAALVGVEQPLKWHPEGDAFEHTMQVVDAAAVLTERLDVRFAALVHDVGKASTPKNKWPSHPGHEAAGVPLVKQLCQRLKVPKQWSHVALFATEQHMKIHQIEKMKATKVVDLLMGAKRSQLGVDGLSIIGLADMRGRNDATATDDNSESLPQMWNVLMSVTGETVLTSGKHLTGQKFGEHLRRLRANELARWRQKTGQK